MRVLTEEIIGSVMACFEKNCRSGQQSRISAVDPEQPFGRLGFFILS